MTFVLLFAYFATFCMSVEAGMLSRIASVRSRPLGGADQLPSSSKNATLNLQARQDDTRYVFMHHIVGSSGGADAIALNFGSDSWQTDQIRNAYSAASGTGVKLFLSFDFSVFPCDVDSVVNTVNQFTQDGSQFKINGRPLISSYLGKCLGNNGWQEIKDRTGGYLMPFIAEIEGQFGSWSSLDSWFCWGCAWPQGDTDKTTADDQYYLQQLGSSIRYVATVSPWMFTHYDYKNFYQRGDDWLIVNRWEQLVGMRDSVPMVEMVTWNDFGESDYFGEIKGAQPSGTTWVNGYSHISFYELSKWYITAYKTGSYPAITEDAIYFWARPHPAQATASADPLARPSGYDYAEDSLWALVFATQPGQVTLTCGSSTQQFSIEAGVNKLKLPLSSGTITVSMTRNGQTIINQSPSDFTYSSSPELYNYNVYAGSAKAGPSASAPTYVPSATEISTPSATPTSQITSDTPPSPTPTPTVTPTSQFTSTTLPSPTSTGVSWNYYGCTEEGTTGSRRALTGTSYSRPDMTPETCQGLCAGYSFAGVEYGQECYCGNSLTNNGASGIPVSTDRCSQPCAGDSSKTCGGEWTLSVYMTSNTTSSPPPNIPSEWNVLGCYADSASRILKGAMISQIGMTTAMCTGECSSRGYAYAATEYGVECYCGNSIEKTSDGAGVSVDESLCGIPCDGNSSEKCGGSWHANVFSSSGSNPSRRHLMKKRRRTWM
ncbi:glycoside hydrolase family 71 protein [Macrolepiota fuliginosa MF-IS2]|uniref:Glycoside hydrolase family 71 protein n=1 Tax=Macrolepiota fuliginosa MF-IS2 TaxID=1400762 RepID=A0A9P5XFK9_9AGAR|nr:glycoside hydrolase family 71 protein [Macrolepiota fuliginosa MF-IS2]